MEMLNKIKRVGSRVSCACGETFMGDLLGFVFGAIGLAALGLLFAGVK